MKTAAPNGTNALTRNRMHVSLNVGDIQSSIAFYAALFGSEPTKVRADYAKFTLDDPGLVLSLLASPTPVEPVGKRVLSHLGFQVPDDEALQARRRSIETAGLEVALEEPGVACCYAVQDKFWVVDPDGNAWEFYRFLADHEGPRAGTSAASTEADGACCVAPSVATAPASGSSGEACCEEPETCCAPESVASESRA